MKNRSIILLIVFIIGIAAVVILTRTSDRPPQRAAVGLEAPVFELEDTEGRTWKLADLKNKVVLLNFWASWCDSCKEENPSLQRLINADTVTNNLVFISVLYKDDPAKAMAYMKTNGFSFPVLIDDKNVSGQYRITGVPETFLIDKKGIVRQKFVGPIAWDAPEIRAALAKLAGE